MILFIRLLLILQCSINHVPVWWNAQRLPQTQDLIKLVIKVVIGLCKKTNGYYLWSDQRKQLKETWRFCIKIFCSTGWREWRSVHVSVHRKLIPYQSKQLGKNELIAQLLSQKKEFWNAKIRWKGRDQRTREIIFKR